MRRRYENLDPYIGSSALPRLPHTSAHTNAARPRAAGTHSTYALARRTAFSSDRNVTVTTKFVSPDKIDDVDEADLAIGEALAQHRPRRDAVALVVEGPAPILRSHSTRSAVKYTTHGDGDVVMSANWRLLGPQEAVIGTLAFGWSTAGIVTAVHPAHRYRHRAEVSPKRHAYRRMQRLVRDSSQEILELDHGLE